MDSARDQVDHELAPGQLLVDADRGRFPAGMHQLDFRGNLQDEPGPQAAVELVELGELLGQERIAIESLGD
jgi:hypothetical protein